MRCSKCGVDNRETARFCDACGANLRDDTLAPADSFRAATLPGERRHLTVLFCDLVDSTAIASKLDPEDWREIVDSYHRTATEAITRFGGSVAQYLGDGVMAYFGYPEAHDNDAERAIRAALAILDEIARLKSQPEHVKLSARVGINSGPVVVGASFAKDANVFGNTPNIAARVQAVAKPDSVVMTADTSRLVPGLFVVEGPGWPTTQGHRAFSATLSCD
jgi:class 3 adenylate cyclase